MKLYLGENLKYLRCRENLTQTQLAEYLNRSQTSVNNYEKNKCIPSLFTVFLIADLFQVTAETLCLKNLSALPEKNCTPQAGPLIQILSEFMEPPKNCGPSFQKKLQDFDSLLALVLDQWQPDQRSARFIRLFGKILLRGSAEAFFQLGQNENKKNGDF